MASFAELARAGSGNRGSGLQASAPVFGLLQTTALVLSLVPVFVHDAVAVTVAVLPVDQVLHGFTVRVAAQVSSASALTA